MSEDTATKFVEDFSTWAADCARFAPQEISRRKMAEMGKRARVLLGWQAESEGE